MKSKTSILALVGTIKTSLDMQLVRDCMRSIAKHAKDNAISDISWKTFLNGLSERLLIEKSPEIFWEILASLSDENVFIKEPNGPFFDPKGQDILEVISKAIGPERSFPAVPEHYAERAKEVPLALGEGMYWVGEAHRALYAIVENPAKFGAEVVEAAQEQIDYANERF